MKRFKKYFAVLLSGIIVFSIAGCASNNDSGQETKSTDITDAQSESAGETVDGSGEDIGIPSITDIALGEEYTDLTASIKILTHRTDIVDTTFQDYIAAFKELYPNITITYEAVTDYAQDVTLRLTTDDWGDICMMPTSLTKAEASEQFVSFGSLEELEKEYSFLNGWSYSGQVYGIASTANAQGIVYNKAVFEEAGITELPTTPDEFLDALQKIKDNTDAIPMYTNFAAEWTMGAWDAYIGGSATGDPDFMNSLCYAENPFSDRGDGTGPYAVYNVLYEAVARGLTEDDPTTTDWEGSKGMINSGQIGTMVLGSWAVVQMQQAGDNSDDIAYMPFPITVDGKQYASAGQDYCYGININSSTDNQIASMLYVKWLTEESNFSYDEGGLPIVIGGEYPETLTAFEDVELVVDNPAPAGEEDLFDNINNESEVGINTNNYTKMEIVEAAIQGSKTLDEIMDEWNQKWTAAQEAFGAR